MARIGSAAPALAFADAASSGLYSNGVRIAAAATMLSSVSALSVVSAAGTMCNT